MSTIENILSSTNNTFENLKKVESKLFIPQLIQLHPNIEGFNSPQSYAVYKNTGGDALGVVGKIYKPMDLNVMFKSIIHSIEDCAEDGLELDLSTLDFKEYLGGKKVAFTVDLPTIEIEGSPMVGDIIKRRIEFRTGFDGKTKSSVTESFHRVWCENGCTNTVSQSLSLKNTERNHMKIYKLCDNLKKSSDNSQDFVTNLGKLSAKDIVQKDIDAFLTKILGYNSKDYSELVKQRRDTLDAINSAIAIEFENTGSNLFSLVNGVTRYTTHAKAGQDEEKLFYGKASDLNVKALNEAFSFLN